MTKTSGGCSAPSLCGSKNTRTPKIQVDVIPRTHTHNLYRYSVEPTLWLSSRYSTYRSPSGSVRSAATTVRNSESFILASRRLGEGSYYCRTRRLVPPKRRLSPWSRGVTSCFHVNTATCTTAACTPRHPTSATTRIGVHFTT